VSLIQAKVLFVLAFFNSCRLAFGRSKSWFPVKFEKSEARLKVLLASDFWHHSTFGSVGAK
jgi:hypothetical protein